MLVSGISENVYDDNLYQAFQVHTGFGDMTHIQGHRRVKKIMKLIVSLFECDSAGHSLFLS